MRFFAFQQRREVAGAKKRVGRPVSVATGVNHRTIRLRLAMWQTVVRRRTSLAPTVPLWNLLGHSWCVIGRRSHGQIHRRDVNHHGSQHQNDAPKLPITMGSGPVRACRRILSVGFVRVRMVVVRMIHLVRPSGLIPMLNSTDSRFDLLVWRFRPTRI